MMWLDAWFQRQGKYCRMISECIIMTWNAEIPWIIDIPVCVSVIPALAKSEKLGRLPVPGKRRSFSLKFGYMIVLTKSYLTLFLWYDQVMSDHYSFGLLAPIHGINPWFQNFISFVQMGIKLGSQFMEPIHAHKLILVAQVLVPSRS
jgi:hypothetical protein